MKHPLTTLLQTDGVDSWLEFDSYEQADQFISALRVAVCHHFNQGRFSEAHRAKLSAVATGRKRSPETRAKMSAAQRDPDAVARRTAKRRLNGTLNHTPEARAKIGASQKGKVVSEETKAKHSASLKGHKHTDETRANMSTARKKMLAERAARLIDDPEDGLD